ncbi:hypothetical protein [Rhodophyticola sp.]|uniref:hypothetical protein n=1 Tax=Rhodophyticola sp. TaxID=2680032 RepID=UPI003D2C6927
MQARAAGAAGHASLLRAIEQLLRTLDNDQHHHRRRPRYVLGSIGNDTINAGANGGTDGYVDLDYSAIERGVDVVINGATGTGSVDKADAGTDSLLGLNAPMDAGAVNGGLGVYGGMNDDSFALNLAAGQWMQVRGGEGTDSYAITGSGDVRLRLDGGFGAVSVNLNTGTVIDDGFGNTEAITGSGLGACRAALATTP